MSRIQEKFHLRTLLCAVCFAAGTAVLSGCAAEQAQSAQSPAVADAASGASAAAVSGASAKATAGTATDATSGASAIALRTGPDGCLYDGQAPQSQLYIWPGKKAPGDISTVREQVIQRAKAGELSDRIYTGTQEPKLALYMPAKSNGTAVVVFPGGAYVRTVIDKEGEVIAPALTRMGYTVAVLNYRLPCDGHIEGSNAALADAQRAVRVMRAKAAELGITQVGVIGFSAGGSLAALMATRFADKTYKAVDRTDRLSARPDFAALMYPVASMQDGITHLQSRESLLGTNPTAEQIEHYSAEKQVTSATPPVFIVHAADDPDVPVQNSILMFEALKAHSIPVEMHIFEKGGHGFGLRNVKGKPAYNWPWLFKDWQQDLGKK